MTHTHAATPFRSHSDTRRPAVVVSLVALVFGVVELLGAALMWYLTATDPSDDPLVGLGYVVALVVGAPGGVGVLLGGLGWLLADRVAGLVLGILAVVATAGPVLLVLGFASPTF